MSTSNASLPDARLQTPDRADDHTPWTWASARLRLGQTNVGFWVIASLGVLLVQPQMTTSGMGEHMVAWAAVVAVYLILQLPFDTVGGYVLPARFGRSTSTPWGFALQLARGIALHAAVLLGVGWGALLVGRSAGDWAAVGVLALFAGVLVAIQGPLGRFVAASATEEQVGFDADFEQALRTASLDPDRVDVLAVDEPVFVGGWTGSRGLERLTLPARWASLPPAELHAVLLRRRIALTSGARARGVVGALAFNTFGASVVLALVPGATYATAGGLLVATAGFTVWSFLGLLTLPTISRMAVYDLDRRVAAELEDRSPLTSVIRRLDREQDDESDRDPRIEAIFHPVPSPERRIETLARPTTDTGGPSMWRVARMALYTSWAHASWLSRAVHCNIGRPGVWVLYPGD